MASIRRRFTSTKCDLDVTHIIQRQSDVVDVVWRLFDVNWRLIDYKSTFQSNMVALNRVNRQFASIYVDLMFDIKSTQFGVKSTQIDVQARPGSTEIDRDRPGLTVHRSGVDQRRLGVDRRRFASIKIDLGIINVDLSYYTLINPNQLISRYFYAM